MGRCRVESPAFALDERGYEPDMAVLWRQPPRLVQPLRRLLQFTPLECNQAEIGPSCWLPRGELGDTLKCRRRQSTLTGLCGRDPSVEGRNCLRVDGRGSVGQRAALARCNTKREKECGGETNSESQSGVTDVVQ